MKQNAITILVCAGLLAMALVISSCSKPIVLSPIAPAVTQAHARATATHASAKRTQRNVAEVWTSSTALGQEIDKATANASRLATAGTATPQQLREQWQALTHIQAHHVLLNSQTSTLAISAADTAALSGKAETDLGELKKQATVLDSGVVKLKTQLVKQADNAALGKGVKIMIWAGVILGFLLLVLLAFVKFIKPI